MIKAIVGERRLCTSVHVRAHCARTVARTRGRSRRHVLPRRRADRVRRLRVVSSIRRPRALSTHHLRRSPPPRHADRAGDAQRASCRRGRSSRRSAISSGSGLLTDPRDRDDQSMGEERHARRRSRGPAGAAEDRRGLAAWQARSDRQARGRLHPARAADGRLPHLCDSDPGLEADLCDRHRIPSRQRAGRASRQHPHRSHAGDPHDSTRPIRCPATTA